MNASRFLGAFLLVCTSLVGPCAWAAPTGKIGLVGVKGAQILNLRSGRRISLPRGSKATILALSPTGAAIYFVPIAGQKKSPNDGGILSNAFVSLPPYTRAQEVPALRRLVPFSLSWNERGTTLSISARRLSATFSPSSGRLSSLGQLPEHVAQSGRKIAYATTNQIVVRDSPNSPERVLFDVRHPAPMFAALKRARNPKKLSDLLSATTDSDAKEANNWQLSDPALSPDSSRLYFASNAGTGVGAAGNGTFALFAVDLRTKALSVLSKVGTNLGRSPFPLRISPDGKRLLFASSVHASAFDNSSFVEVVDLQTQSSREVLNGVLPDSKNKANFLDSAIWSPDGKYVALSAYFYNPQTADPSDSDPKPTQYTTGIVDAATGRLIRTIQGVKSFGWAR